MYKAEELCGLLIKPKINDIDLDVLQDYYRKFLNPFIYQYDITENEKQSSIQLRFDEENFCHLLGIESIVKYSVSKKGNTPLQGTRRLGLYTEYRSLF